MVVLDYYLNVIFKILGELTFSLLPRFSRMITSRDESHFILIHFTLYFLFPHINIYVVTFYSILFGNDAVEESKYLAQDGNKTAAIFLESIHKLRTLSTIAGTKYFTAIKYILLYYHGLKCIR